MKKKYEEPETLSAISECCGGEDYCETEEKKHKETVKDGNKASF
jgi:hypothetical protein